jgi:septal ring factor EnvC (AmiA/AmiB activator)
LASVEKELQQAKMDNATLAHYINAKRKKEEDQRKEEDRKKAEEDQSSKGTFPPASLISMTFSV